MALVSDDLALLDADSRELLDEVLAVGRAVDASARRSHPPRCVDLLDATTPTSLAGGGHSFALELDPVSATLVPAQRHG